MKSQEPSAGTRMQGAEHRSVPHLMPSRQKDLRLCGIHIRVVSDLVGIESLETRWRQLTSEESAPFQTFTWNLAWYRHFRKQYDSVFILVAEREGEVIAILPCYTKGRQIRLAGDSAGDYQDILAGSQSDANAALGAFFEFTQREFPFHSFFFRKVSSQGRLHHYFEDGTLLGEDMITFTRRFAPSPFVSIDAGLESYLASLPRKPRQDMRRSLRRFDREFPSARVEMIRSLDIRVSDLENVAEFHSDHFRKDGISPLADPALRGMLGEVAKDPDVGLQLGALVDQGEMLAIDVGFARGGRYYGYLTGFDAQFGKFAPGKCLLLKRIDSWVEKDGVKVLDFLSGDEPYKTGFTHGESYEVNSIHWMPNRMRSRARRATLVAERFGRQVAKQAISKLALSR